MIMSQNEDMSIEIIESVVKYSVNSTLSKLGQYMATLEEELDTEEKEIERTSDYDQQPITTTSTAELVTEDEVYTVPK